MSTGVDHAEALTMIRESAAGIADRGDLGRIRALRYARPGIDRGTWRAACDMGWPALLLPEDRGGLGLGMAACCALTEELGAALVPEPLIGAMLCARLLEGDVLADLLAGDKVILPAWQEGRRRFSTGAGIQVENGRLTGTKLYITMADAADAFVVLAGDDAWMVDRVADGVTLDTLTTQDGGHLGTLSLAGAPARALAGDVGSTLDRGALATAAYLLGVADAALTRTLDHLRTRVQFGKPIGSFQALQHRAVDLALEVRLTRASVDDAARRWDAAPGSAEGRAAVSRAKARASSTALLVTREAIQLHGGIGYTDEHDIGLYLRKAMTVASAFGDAGVHRDRFAELQPLVLEDA